MAKLVNCDSIAPDWQPGSLVLGQVLASPLGFAAGSACVALRGCRLEGGGGTGCASICYRFMLAAWPAASVSL